MVKIYCFDLDDTLCHTKGLDYLTAEPIAAHIKTVNKLYENGNYIKIFTARGSETKIDWYQITYDQLIKWNVSFHELILGKPAADYYVDDKAVNVMDFEWLS